MSHQMLSREMARWLQSCPGPLKSDNEDSLLLLAKLKFVEDRRWRGEEFDLAIFASFLNTLGYRPEPRDRHTNTGRESYWHLPLPEKHRGF